MEIINVTDEIIEINVTEEVINIQAPTGAYPFPNAVNSVFGRVGAIVAAEGDYNLTQLGDVTLTSPANGQVLKYNGTQWVNSTDADTGITTLNTLTALSQTFATGTSGTDFNISSATSTHTFNFPTASATNRGLLSSANWSNFNTAYNDSITSAAVTGTTTKTLTLNQQDGGTITASWTDINTDAVTSVFGRTGAVVATSGDYTTTQVTEGTNLYFTDARARAAITLTTTGTSGAATYSGGTLNIPQYQGVLTNPVTGTGTTNTLPKFTGASTIGNSNITDTGSLITLGSNSYISSGGLGIGTSSLTGYSLIVSKNITGSVAGYGVSSNGQIQSDVTIGRYFSSTASTQAATFSAQIYHYQASQGTIGAGSTITNQIGFLVDSTLIGATNNYGFYGNIASGTNRWNLYMVGTANNYLAGKLLIGSTTDAGAFALQVTGDIVASRVYSTGITGGVAYALDNNRSIRNIGGTTGTGTTFFDLNYSVFRREDGASTGARIGINMTPTETLDVSGTGRISGTLTAASFIPTSSTIPTNGMYLSGTNTLGFATNGTLDMVINEAGTLGLGLTPASNWGRTGFEIGVAGASITREVRDLVLLSNSIWTSSGLVYAATAGAGRFDVGVSSFRWYTAPSGTGGNAISFTQAMTLDANGALGIGTTSLTGFTLRLDKNITGSANPQAFSAGGTIQTDATGVVVLIGTSLQTVASANSSNVYHYNTGTGSIGAGTTIGNLYGYVASGLTQGTNNFGFYGNIAAAANRYNLYMNGTANNYMAGSLGIGTTSLAGYTLRLAKTATGAANYYAIESAGTVQSDVAGSMQYFQSVASTQASTFTLGALRHYFAFQSTFGAGSTVTTQIGYFAHESMIGATNNFGFYGNIPSGTNRWNLYMAGTAANYMAGTLSIGGTAINPNAVLQINSNLNQPQNIVVSNSSSSSAAQCGIQLISDAGTASFNAYSSTFATTDLQSSALLSSGSSANGLIITTATTSPIRLRTNSVERVRIKSTGQMRFVPLASDPSGAEAGDVYYNSTTNKLKVYNGTTWETITSA